MRPSYWATSAIIDRWHDQGWTQDDLDTLLKLPRQVSDADIMALLELQGTTIPYAYPVSNKVTQPYDRIKNKIVADARPATDCVETLARHLFTMIFFNAKTKGWNLEAVKGLYAQRGEDPRDPLGALIRFYSSLPLSDANTHSLEGRSAWNQVMGDLNRLEELGFKTRALGFYIAMNMRA